MSQSKAKEITQAQLLLALSDANKQGSSVRYGFILGAGASVTSGIPSGNKLATKWYDEIQESIGEEDLKQWIQGIEGFDKDNIAASYTKIFKKRFEVDYHLGYQELQRYMDNAKPSIGYSFLAQVLDRTANKFVITTNFDTMTEDALFELGNAKPLVLGHEVLSKFINAVSPTRPTIIKIHRDFLFDPYNTDDEIEELDKQWQESLEPVLTENAMIVLGYGGNDESLMNYLEQIDNRKPIYWCYREEYELSDKIKGLLTEKDFIVKITSFDKFMLLLSDKLGFKVLINQENIEESQIVKNAIRYANAYARQLEKLTKEELNPTEQKAIKKLLPSWWYYQIKVNNEQNIDERDKIYQEGIEAYNKSHELLGNYANFLHNIRKEYDKAEEYYKKALEIEPEDAIYNGNYAIFLHNIRKEYDKAEEYYKKALEIEPENANNNGNYAQFLLEKGKLGDAKIYINNAFKYQSYENDLELELWFYRLVYYPEYFEEAQKELDRLLAEGYRSIGWNFDSNIEQAKKDEFKEIELLEEYAKRITEE